MIGTLAVALLLTGEPRPASAGVKWERQFDEALRRAKAAGKPLLVDFWADWCGWCHRLDQTTYVDPAVVRLSEDFVAVKVDTEGGPRQAAIAGKYDVASLPTIVFLSPAGRQVLRVNGFQGPGQFPRTMEAAKETAKAVIAWESAIEKDPKDASALMKLGVHLFEQEFYEDSRDLLYRAARADQAAPAADRSRARMLLGIIQTYDRKYVDAERLLKEALGLAQGSEQQPKVLFVLGRAYFSWGKRAEAREVMLRIVTEHAASPVAQKARETLVLLERAPEHRR